MSNSNTKEIAERLKGLREMMEISVADMAAAAGGDEKTYLAYENGEERKSTRLHSRRHSIPCAKA